MNRQYEPINFVGIDNTKEQLRQKRAETAIFWGICLFSFISFAAVLCGLLMTNPLV